MSEESASLEGPRASRLGVCGIGEIGLGVARCALLSGFEVLVWDADGDRRDNVVASPLSAMPAFDLDHAGIG